MYDLKLAGIPMPDRIKALPICPQRRVPIPWFVSTLPDGAREFRCADGDKLVSAIRDKLCWVCGQHLGVWKVFIIGPMCSVNRVSAEPPCHADCAEFSVCACPFLTKPHMVRRENDLPENSTEGAGHMIRRNPGASALWTVRDYRLISDGRGGVLFNIGEPTTVSWWAEGRKATLAEVEASIESGLPILRGFAEQDGPVALAQLEMMANKARKFLPRELVTA